MATPLPQAGYPLALLRPTGRAAGGRAGLQTAAAPQRTAASAAGAAQAAQLAQGATQTAARALSFAQLLGKAADQRQTTTNGAPAGMDEALHAERPARTTVADDELGAQADAALELASLQAGAAALAPNAPPAAVATALPAPGAAAATGVPLPHAAAAVEAADPPTALPQGAEPAAPTAQAQAQAQAQAPAPALGQPAPRSDGRNPHNSVARATHATPTPSTAPDGGLPPATGPARPAEPGAVELPAPAIGETQRSATDGEAAQPASTRAPGAAAGPALAPEAAAQASRAGQAPDPLAARASSVRGEGAAPRPVDRPAGQPAEQPAVRAAVARASTPAAPVPPFGQEAPEAGGRARRAATEGGPATGTAGVHSPAGNAAAAPAAPAAARAPVLAPAAAAAEPASAMHPARIDAVPEAPLPLASWIAAPAAVASTIAGAPALPADAQASLAAHPQSTAFAPELGAQLTHFARNGVEHARLSLNPAEMGPVTVQIQLEGSNAQVHLSAEHTLTRQALEQAMPQLAGSLREAGLTLSGGGVFEQPRQGRDAPGADDGRRPQPARADAGGDDAALAGLAATAAPALRRRGVVDLVA